MRLHGLDRACAAPAPEAPGAGAAHKRPARLRGKRRRGRPGRQGGPARRAGRGLRVFITGLIGFALSSALGGAATSFGMLVAARTLQGTFGAILAPSALGTLISIFRDPRERGRAFGVFGSVAGGGGRGPHLIFAAVAVAGALIYMQGNLQQVKGYSPVTCGLAFLPMFGCILASSNTSSSGTAPSSGAGDTISSRA